jgi:hypothetical protein
LRCREELVEQRSTGDHASTRGIGLSNEIGHEIRNFVMRLPFKPGDRAPVL